MKLFAGIFISVLLATSANSVLASNPEFEVLESSTANVACYSIDPDSPFNMFRNPPFIKNNFVYFTPETEFFYYWARLNRGTLISMALSAKILLPDGEIAYTDWLSIPSSDTDKPIIIKGMVPLRNKIKGRRITPDKYGRWSIEIYLMGKLLDKKYFYVDTEDKLIDIADKNNEKTNVVKYYNDLKTYKETQHVILEKDGKVKFIYLGFSKERLLEEIGQPSKIETAKESAETFEKWIYLTDIKVRPRLGGWISRLDSSIQEGDAARIVTDKKDSGFACAVIFHIENGHAVRIRFP